jgi:hypothetical protein
MIKHNITYSEVCPISFGHYIVCDSLIDLRLLVTSLVSSDVSRVELFTILYFSDAASVNVDNNFRNMRNNNISFYWTCKNEHIATKYMIKHNITYSEVSCGRFSNVLLLTNDILLFLMFLKLLSTFTEA